MLTRLREEQFWLMTGALLLIAFAAFSFSMYFTRIFMIPFVFSIFLTAMVSPLDDFLVIRCRAPRWVGFIGAMAVILCLIALLIVVMTYAIQSVSETLRDFSGNTEAFIGKMDDIIAYLGIPHEYLNTRTILNPIRQQGPEYLKATISLFQTFISSSILVLLFCLFILMGRNPRRTIRNEIYMEVESSIRKYLNIKFFISLATGICVYVTLWILGLPLAFLFGILAFVLNFIPSIGSIVATVLPIPVALITPEFTPAGVFWVVLIPTCFQQFFGNLLEPKLQGDSLKLHPVTILLALGFWGVVWGPVGMLLAAPLTAAMRIVMTEFRMTQWIAGIMGGELPDFQRNVPEIPQGGRGDV
ncbi:MAG: AI-2E family transporter [Planctomycetia bacterium]|nr:AI-2E family transporter [Planctomycetia bacterium]